MVSTIHFGSILVASLENISTSQDGWLHDATINIHHGKSHWNQEPQKSTKSFPEEIQMFCAFKKSYSAVPQEFLWNGKCPHKEETWAISYFFEDSAGKAVTVTSERYTQMLREYLLPIVEEKGISSYHFQQDGATSHTARVAMALLREKFPGKLI